VLENKSRKMDTVDKVNEGKINKELQRVTRREMNSKEEKSRKKKQWEDHREMEGKTFVEKKSSEKQFARPTPCSFL